MLYSNGYDSYGLQDFNGAIQTATNDQVTADEQVMALATQINTTNINFLTQQSQQAQATLQPFIQMGQQGASALSGLLGIGSATQNGQQQTALNNMLNSPMIQSQLQFGTEGVTNQLAGQGLTGSGAAMKQLQSYGQGIAANQIGTYQQGLASLVGMGQQAAGQSANLSNTLGTQVADQNTQMANTQSNALLNIGQVEAQGVMSQAQMSLQAAMGGFGSSGGGGPSMGQAAGIIGGGSAGWTGIMGALGAAI
jgi:hypothetical protein